MGAFEEISDRRIRAGREAGLFDGLEGAGKPIRDIDRIRPPGWWAMRVAEAERSKMRSEDLQAEIAATMPSLWRAEAADDAAGLIVELNERIDAYNAHTTWEPIERLDTGELLKTWTRIRAERRDRSAD